MKKRILVVECMSTGVNYIEDIIKRGYEPVVVEGHVALSEEYAAQIKEDRRQIRARLSSRVRYIDENPDYQEVLRQAREVNPVHVVAGSEFGVPLAVRLAQDLKLPGNPLGILDAMTQKDAMHEALSRAGIRHIRGRVVHSVEEAVECYDEFGEKGVVVKFTRSAATVGLTMCNSREEMIAAVRKGLGQSFGTVDEKSELLVQERIHGKEYIVNTVSCQGEHRMVSIWAYDKVRLPNGTNAYNYGETVTELGVGHSQLIRYAFDVLEAIGIQYGPVHGEYMVDEKGPVLIEVNCRPMGGSLPRKFLDAIFEQHETDSALDAYIDPKRFLRQKSLPYRPRRKGALKVFILPEDVDLTSAPVMPICRQLRSFYSASFDRVGKGDGFMQETSNLETSGGYLYLLHEDEQVVKQDLELLHALEMQFPQILFNDHKRLPVQPKGKADIPGIMREMELLGSTLVFSDNRSEEEGVILVNRDTLKSAGDGFDQGILDIADPVNFIDIESIVQQFFLFFRKVRQGGRIIVPETTYRHLPYGMDGIDIIARVAGLVIEVPNSGSSRLVVASVPVLRRM